MAAHDLDLYWPYDAGAGANILESQWRQIASWWLTDGVVNGELSNFAPSTTAGRNIVVGAGRAWVRGAFGELSTAFTQPFATNTSGSTRVDLVVLRNDFTANKVVLDVIQGTPGGPWPALTQNTAIWEIPLYGVVLATGYTAIASTDWTDVREFAQGRPPGGPLVAACAVTRGALTVAANTWTALGYDGEDYDTAGIHPTDAAYLQIPVGMAGLWRFTFTDQWDATANGGDRGVRFYLNGSAVRYLDFRHDANGSPITTVPYEDVFAVGDQVAFWVEQTSSNVLALDGARLTGHYLGPVA